MWVLGLVGPTLVREHSFIPQSDLFGIGESNSEFKLPPH